MLRCMLLLLLVATPLAAGAAGPMPERGREPSESSAAPAPRSGPEAGQVARVAPAPAAARFRKGMAILPYRGDYDQAHLPGTVDRLYDRLAGLGVDAVSISVPLYQETHTANEIRRGDRTPPDEDLRLMFRKAATRGWWVTFRPYLDESNFHVEDKVWRGNLAPTDRDAWFRSYTRLLLGYAKLAQQTGVDTFIVGVELNSLDGDPRWPDMIRAVRKVYAGQVTYAANWDHVEQVPFWGELDLIGIDSFYPLEVDPDDVTVGTVTRAWQPWVRQVEGIRARYRKPIVFLELGVTAQRAGLRAPWTWDTSSPVDVGVQRTFYEATCGVVKPLVQGMYWWVAFLWLQPADPLQDRSHSPFGKPAEREIRNCYSAAPASAVPAASPQRPSRRAQQSTRPDE